MEHIAKVELYPGETMRVDKYISTLGLIKRSQFESHKLKVSCDNKEVKFSKKLKGGETLKIVWEQPEEPDYGPEEIDLNIIYEDDNVIVINKPQGLVVHPGAGNYHGTLVQGLLFYNKNLAKSFEGEVLRPGIVHRLDKDTSGLIITAKDTNSLEMLSEQFRKRSTEKYYLAIVKGRMPLRRGDIKMNIARDEKNRKKFTVHETKGKPALTRYEVLKTWDNHTLLRLKLETGRTHQIRVHLLAMGCPIVGDPIYSRRDNKLGDVTLMLHSSQLKITLPGEEEPRTFEAPIPERFIELEERLTAMNSQPI